jgi:hypothetical protein
MKSLNRFHQFNQFHQVRQFPFGEISELAEAIQPVRIGSNGRMTTISLSLSYQIKSLSLCKEVNQFNQFNHFTSDETIERVPSMQWVRIRRSFGIPSISFGKSCQAKLSPQFNQLNELASERVMEVVQRIQSNQSVHIT